MKETQKNGGEWGERKTNKKQRRTLKFLIKMKIFYTIEGGNVQKEGKGLGEGKLQLA